MSRRYSPRALNSRTDMSEMDTFNLAYDYTEAWEAALDSDDHLFTDDDDDETRDEFIELTETEYDDDWDDYWRDRRARQRSRS